MKKTKISLLLILLVIVLGACGTVNNSVLKGKIKSNQTSKEKKISTNGSEVNFSSNEGDFTVTLPDNTWKLTEEEETFYVETSTSEIFIAIETYNPKDTNSWESFKEGRLTFFEEIYGDIQNEETIKTDNGETNRYYFTTEQDGIKLNVILDLRPEKDVYIQTWGVSLPSKFDKEKPIITSIMESAHKK